MPIIKHDAVNNVSGDNANFKGLDGSNRTKWNCPIVTKSALVDELQQNFVILFSIHASHIVCVINASCSNKTQFVKRNAKLETTEDVYCCRKIAVSRYLRLSCAFIMLDSDYYQFYDLI